MLVRITGDFIVSGDADLEEQADALQDFLLDAEAATEGAVLDTSVAATVGAREVEISMIVDAPNLALAEQIGQAVMFVAIRGVGGAVEGEPAPDVSVVSMEPVDTTEAASLHFVPQSRGAQLVDA